MNLKTELMHMVHCVLKHNLHSFMLTSTLHRDVKVQKHDPHMLQKVLSLQSHVVASVTSQFSHNLPLPLNTQTQQCMHDPGTNRVAWIDGPDEQLQPARNLALL